MSVLTCVVLCALVPAPQAQKSAPALADVLKAAGDYVLQYSQKMQAVGAEEEFLQMDTGGGRINHTRRLSSDVVMVGLDRSQVEVFRDAYAIDTKSLHERSDRLFKLFADPPGPPIGPLQYAQRYTEESVRAYVSPNLHLTDSPMTAFVLFRSDNQQRSVFKLDSVKTNDGAQVAVLKFNERAKPSLVIDNADALASGRLWVELPSGAIRQTELIIANKLLNLRTSTTFALDQTTGLWLPKELNQIFDVSEPGPGGSSAPNMHESFETHVKYAKFRQVAIEQAKMR